MLTVLEVVSHFDTFFFPSGVGTRFVAAVEASAPKKHKELILSAGFEDAITTVIYTGRPLRVRRTPYVEDW